MVETLSSLPFDSLIVSTADVDRCSGQNCRRLRSWSVNPFFRFSHSILMILVFRVRGQSVGLLTRGSLHPVYITWNAPCAHGAVIPSLHRWHQTFLPNLTSFMRGKATGMQLSAAQQCQSPSILNRSRCSSLMMHAAHERHTSNHDPLTPTTTTTTTTTTTAVTAPVITLPSEPCLPY